MLYNFLVATYDLATADSQNISIVKAITKMPALKKVGFLAITFLTSHLVNANNEITFCNIPYVPKAGSPDDIAHCLGQYGLVLNKCYVIPAGYGLKGQSFSVCVATYQHLLDRVLTGGITGYRWLLCMRSLLGFELPYSKSGWGLVWC